MMNSKRLDLRLVNQLSGL